jgi:hypothetical protein
MTLILDNIQQEMRKQLAVLQEENRKLHAEMDLCQQNTTALVHDVEDANAYLTLCVADSRVTSNKLHAMEEAFQGAQEQNHQLMAALVETSCQADLISATRENKTCRKALSESTAVKNELWLRHDSCIVQARDANKRNEQLEVEMISLLDEIEHIKTTKHPRWVFPVWKPLTRLWRIVLPKRFRGVDWAHLASNPHIYIPNSVLKQNALITYTGGLATAAKNKKEQTLGICTDQLPPAIGRFEARMPC